jgi:hypothetical protein
MTPLQQPPSLDTDPLIKVLEAFCTVASRFEKDVRQVGVSEVTHLIAVARVAAEEALIQHQKALCPPTTDDANSKPSENAEG